MDFMTSVKTCLVSKYACFEGKATRPEFWWFALFNFLVSCVLMGIGHALGITWLSSIYSLAVLIPGLAVGARRLHDINKSGWWQLIALIPLIGAIVLIVFWAQKSSDSNS